jgi:phosphohistidine phosphatase
LRILYLLRHAKSAWDDPGIDDFDRALNKRGQRTTRLLAQFFEAEAIRPAMILCSPARRTRDTLGPLLPVFGEIPVIFDRRIYEAGWTTLRTVLKGLSDSADTALLIGHNPGLQQLALHLAREQANPLSARLAEKFPTGTLAVLASPAERWSEMNRGGCDLIKLVRPADLGDAAAD